MAPRRLTTEQLTHCSIYIYPCTSRTLHFFFALLSCNISQLLHIAIPPCISSSSYALCSSWVHWPLTNVLHFARLLAVLSPSPQLSPFPAISAWTLLLQLFLGRPGFLLPC